MARKLVLLVLWGLWSVACLSDATIHAEWKDPLTNKAWIYLSPGLNWNAAGQACTDEGYRLPSMEELQVAQRRLVRSPVGQQLLLAHELVWSSTEGDAVVPQSWAVYLRSGNASWVMQVNPLPVACVTDT